MFEMFGESGSGSDGSVRGAGRLTVHMFGRWQTKSTVGYGIPG